jgi:hypothetical protein
MAARKDLEEMAAHLLKNRQERHPGKHRLEHRMAREAPAQGERLLRCRQAKHLPVRCRAVPEEWAARRV